MRSRSFAFPVASLRLTAHLWTAWIAFTAAPSRNTSVVSPGSLFNRDESVVRTHSSLCSVWKSRSPPVAASPIGSLRLVSQQPARNVTYVCYVTRRGARNGQNRWGISDTQNQLQLS